MKREVKQTYRFELIEEQIEMKGVIYSKAFYDKIVPIKQKLEEM